jgi:hypothetical protein
VAFLAIAGVAAISKSILVAVDAKDDKLWHRITYAVFWSLVAIKARLSQIKISRHMRDASLLMRSIDE